MLTDEAGFPMRGGMGYETLILVPRYGSFISTLILTRQPRRRPHGPRKRHARGRYRRWPK